MEWKLIYHRNAIKFLKKLEKEKREHILDKLYELLNSMEKGILPIRTMDIKRLKGKWEGFFRLRVGELRIIFRIDVESKKILIYNIHFRERSY
ncbi:MAG: type II toxin-antitoxin system RelE/ParE family toxin [Archaeoglobaceae archaeon]